MRADPIGLFELIRIQFSPNQIQPDLKLNPSSDWIRSIWIRSCPIPTPLAHNRLQACQVLIGGTELCDSPLSLTRFLSLIFIHLKTLEGYNFFIIATFHRLMHCFPSPSRGDSDVQTKNMNTVQTPVPKIRKEKSHKSAPTDPPPLAHKWEFLTNCSWGQIIARWCPQHHSNLLYPCFKRIWSKNRYHLTVNHTQ